jgi:hypothetical protein
LRLSLDRCILPQPEAELPALNLRRQFTINHKVRGFDEITHFRELVDGVAAMTKDAVVTIQKRDLALAGARVPVALVVRHIPRRTAQPAHVDRFLPFGAFHDWQGVVFIFQLERRSRGHIKTSEPKSAPLAKKSLGQARE